MDHQLPLLLRHYAALSPSSPALLPAPPFPTSRQLSLPTTQQWLVDHLLQHDQQQQDEERGGAAWKKVFWRRVVKAVEQGFDERRAEGDDQVDDEVRPTQASTLSLPDTRADRLPHALLAGGPPRHPRDDGRLPLVRRISRRTGRLDSHLLLGRHLEGAERVGEPAHEGGGPAHQRRCVSLSSSHSLPVGPPANGLRLDAGTTGLRTWCVSSLEPPAVAP